jgi:hypothetical protein
MVFNHNRRKFDSEARIKKPPEAEAANGLFTFLLTAHPLQTAGTPMVVPVRYA